MFAISLGPTTIGYAFAYFAFIRCSDYRDAAHSGSTFFALFASRNPRRSKAP